MEANDNTEENDRPDSCRLSLGSSPSELSEDDDDNQNLVDPNDDFGLDDGDGSLTPTDKIVMEDDDDDDNGNQSLPGQGKFGDGGLFEDSSDTLSNAPMDMDDREDETLSSLFSVHDGTPLSPEQKSSKGDEEEEEDEEEENTPLHKDITEEDSGKRKRRGSETLEGSEWNARRSSKVLQNKVLTVQIAAEVSGCEKEADQNQKQSTQSNAQPIFESPTDIHTDTPRLEEEQTIKQSRNSRSTKKESSDSEDHEYQQWHKEALDALTKIELEFARLRDKMYQEKMSELNEEALRIADGTHPELLAMMESIEEKRRKRIQAAEAWRKHRRINYQRQLEGLEYQAHIDFVAGKNALRRNLLASLNRKRWDLDHEREKLNAWPSDADRVPDPKVLLEHRRVQFQESKELDHLQQTVGFPRATRTAGLSPKSIEEDLIALGLTEPTMNSVQDKTTKTSINHPEKQLLKTNVLDTSLSHISHSSGHVYTFQGQLHYHGRIFRKGDHFTIVDANAVRYNAKLLTANESEVHIQRTDGSKTKLSFAQLSKGKYQIYAKQS